MNPIISICIPAYNRPKELNRLLKSIDSVRHNSIRILICEDKSPKRDEIREVVNLFKQSTLFDVTYIENETNLGYDNNIKKLVSYSDGDYILFMGDDDTFVPNSLDLLSTFLSNNSDLGYVLKSHRFFYENGNIEEFRYFDGDKFFNKGEDTYISLFRRSVFISGFTIKKEAINDLITDKFDGGLLYQLYLLAETALNYPCAYFDTPLTQADENGIPYFGSSEVEKNLYTPGTITIENSIQFLSGFFDITAYIDKKYGIESTDKIKHDMSKYFYPSLAIQRDKGIFDFFKYIKKLRGMGFNSSVYFYIYAIGLTFFGKKICDYIVLTLKRKIGRTPQL
ncbi:glycosyltransferase family A protein [Pseudoalteromonas sp. SG44-8]|uniref:glycosyltransferase family 2 protein n=1 Tax=Pseudoalteromonas sp. SG44-8 TaxID=2760958 RepID=UPI001601DFB9|nr:glycosyltransferase family A protein [Pseudoalteromonas sp. SG44-8]MBB1399448.1 glycosyltransferase family 2 protein [Pseudoalteromonas sp. SG44-8]